MNLLLTTIKELIKDNSNELNKIMKPETFAYGLLIITLTIVWGSGYLWFMLWKEKRKNNKVTK